MLNPYPTIPVPGEPELPLGPSCYDMAETCAECWEPFSSGFVDRWLHRRKWGHNPIPLHPRLTEPDLHARNVEGARRYRGYTPAPPVDPRLRSWG